MQQYRWTFTIMLFILLGEPAVVVPTGFGGEVVAVDYREAAQASFALIRAEIRRLSRETGKPVSVSEFRLVRVESTATTERTETNGKQ